MFIVHWTEQGDTLDCGSLFFFFSPWFSTDNILGKNEILSRNIIERLSVSPKDDRWSEADTCWAYRADSSASCMTHTCHLPTN